MTPQNKALTALGLSVNDVVNRLTEYSRPAEYARWVVRWQGRIRAMDGHSMFSSRSSASDAARTWLRETLRNAMFSQTHRMVKVDDPTPPGKLPPNWGYTKSYRDYVDALLAHLESEGIIQYVEIEPPLRPANQVVANG